MAGLKTIKTKIRSIKKTQKVTKAMEAVSASKMRKAQGRALAGRAYARAAVAILARVSGSQELKTHPMLRGVDPLRNNTLLRRDERETPAQGIISSLDRALYIVITSDKGLAGALNSAVLRAVAADIASKGLSREQVSIVAVGRKANDFFAARGYRVEVYHPHTDAIDAMLVHELVHEAAARFVRGETDVVQIAYQQFISTFEQRPTIRTVFPLSLSELRHVVKDIVPTRGAFSDLATNHEVDPHTYYVEPTEHDVLSAILPRLASIFVYHALLESQASEHSARMVSMKSASDKAGELTDRFTLQFNKARQASITREVSEITGGMEAMAG